jgi:hypothetical protein
MSACASGTALPRGGLLKRGHGESPGEAGGAMVALSRLHSHRCKRSGAAKRQTTTLVATRPATREQYERIVETLALHRHSEQARSTAECQQERSVSVPAQQCRSRSHTQDRRHKPGACCQGVFPRAAVGVSVRASKVGNIIIPFHFCNIIDAAFLCVRPQSSHRTWQTNTQFTAMLCSTESDHNIHISAH